MPWDETRHGQGVADMDATHREFAELTLDVDGGQRRKQIPDRLDRVGVDGRAAEGEAVGFLNEVGKDVGFAAFEVVERNAHAADALGAGGQRLGHAPGVAVSREVEDDQRLFAARLVEQARRRQFAVAVHVIAWLVAQDRAVRRGDQFDVERFDQRHGVEYVLAEGPHDVGVVVLEGKAEIADGIVEQPVVAKMTTENVTGEQQAVLFEIGALGVRPVQVGGVQEAQRAAAEVDGVVGGDRDVFGRLLAGRLQQCLEHHLVKGTEIFGREEARYLGNLPFVTG